MIDMQEIYKGAALYAAAGYLGGCPGTPSEAASALGARRDRCARSTPVSVGRHGGHGEPRPAGRAGSAGGTAWPPAAAGAAGRKCLLEFLYVQLCTASGTMRHTTAPRARGGRDLSRRGVGAASRTDIRARCNVALRGEKSRAPVVVACDRSPQWDCGGVRLGAAEGCRLSATARLVGTVWYHAVCHR